MLTDTYNYLRLSDRLGTAGQPTVDQLREIAEAGFEIVINLALPTSDHAVANEGSIVTSLGMSYVNIPVDFETPAANDFRLFSAAMTGCGDRPVFVHCAANKRVSAFVYLHRVTQGNTAPEEAEKDLHRIWRPDENWTRFISSVTG